MERRVVKDNHITALTVTLELDDCMKRTHPGLVRGSMMIAGSLTTAGVLTLLSSIIIARSVSVTEFGYYSITTSLQSVVSLFSSFSIGVAVARFVAEYNIRDVNGALKFAKCGLRLVLVFSTVTAVAYFALADPIGNGLYSEPGVAELVPFSAMVVFSSAVLALASGVVQGSHHMKMLSSMQVSTPLISLCIIVTMLPFVGIRVAFIGLFVAQITIALLAIHHLGKTGFHVGLKIEPGVRTHYSKRILAFAVPAVIGAAMVAPLYWFGNTVLALSSGFLAVGHFAVAMVFFHALSLLPNSLAIPLVPRVSAMSVHSGEHIESLISRSVRAVSVLFFPLFFAIALFSRDIIGTLYGTEYRDSGEVMYLMVAASYFHAMATTIGSAIVGLGRMWVGLGLNIIWAAVFATAALIAVPLYGLNGLGYAFVISYGIHLATSITVSNRVLRIGIKNVFWTIALSITLFATGFLQMTGTSDSFILVKLALFAIGTGLMMHLGRSEIRIVLARVFERRRIST